MCDVWSVKTLLRLSLRKKSRLSGKDMVGTSFSSNYRSFIFRKFPPPARPGLCYIFLRQLPPRLVQVLLLYKYTVQDIYIYLPHSFHASLAHLFLHEAQSAHKIKGK